MLELLLFKRWYSGKWVCVCVCVGVCVCGGGEKMKVDTCKWEEIKCDGVFVWDEWAGGRYESWSEREEGRKGRRA